MMIQKDVSLASYHTFGVDLSCWYLTEINHLQDIAEIIEWRNQNSLPSLIVGGGSNLLFKSDYQGLIIHVALQGKALISRDDEASYIEAAAGENWHEFVRWTIDQGYAGLENLSLIPGTVGAAPVQNIGAYGVELVDRLYSLKAIDLQTGEKKEFTNEQCQFGYRDSYFKSVKPNRYLITSVVFRLLHKLEWAISYAGIKDQLVGQTPSSRLISDLIISVRKSKLPDPKVIGNAGSFFKNPILGSLEWEQIKQKHPSLPGYPQKNNQVKTSAAWLIDQCGWKGQAFDNGSGVYDKHALILVNYGGATGADLWSLAQKIIISVNDKFSILLEPEPKVMG